MAGPISSILSISRSSLNAQSQALRVTSNNISNANVEGYNRREVNLESQLTGESESLQFGNGVSAEGVIRIADSFVENNLRQKVGERAAAEVRDELLARAETQFSLDDTIPNIGSRIQEFYSSLEDLQLDPSNYSLRSEVVSTAENLVSSIRDTYNALADLQREADSRIEFAVEEVNRLTANIAELNGSISQNRSVGVGVPGLEDQRDQLMKELASFVSFSKVENTDGSVNIALEGGFTLVSGTTPRSLDFLPVPEITGATFPDGLDGAPLKSIVYSFGTGAGSDIDLTSQLAAGNGEIAGLLNARGVKTLESSNPFTADGDLTRMAARVESISISLLTTLNQAYRGDDVTTPAIEGDDVATPATVESIAVDGNGNFITDAFPLFGIDNFTSADLDVSGNAYPTYTGDLDTFVATPGNPSSFSGRLSLNVTDPALLVTGVDLDVTTGGAQTAEADATVVERMLLTKDQVISLPSGTLGAYSPDATISGTFEEAISFIGSLKAASASELALASEREVQAEQIRSSISGVNLDEEFASLIEFQRLFEASARLIRVGDEMFTELISILR